MLAVIISEQWNYGLFLVSSFWVFSPVFYNAHVFIVQRTDLLRRGRLDQQRRNLTAENTAPRSQVSSPPGTTPGKGPVRKADTQVISA